MRRILYAVGELFLVSLALGSGVSCYAEPSGRGLDRTASLTGLTGLIRVPNAFVLRQEHARFVYTPPMGMGPVSIGARSSFAAVAGVVPHTEFAFSLGPASQDFDLAGHGKVNLLNASGSMPAVALGVVDVARNGPKGSTGFLVATWPLLDNQVGLTLGGAFSGNHGLLAGLQVRLGNAIELQAEYDTERVNYGIVAALGDRAFARVANLSTGTTATVGFSWPMAYLPPRKLEPPARKPPEGAISEAMERIKEALVKSGFEDVQVSATLIGENSELAVAYDDRCFTVNQLDGLPDVLKVMAENAPPNTVALVARLRRRALVMAEYRVPLETFKRYAAGDATPADMREASEVTLLPPTGEMRGPQQETAVANSSFGHVDVVLSPGVRTVLGTETDVFQIGVFGRVEVVAPLGRGAQAQARWIYPLGGELVDEEPRRWRNDRAVVSYAFSPRPRWLAQVIAGKFPRSADGVVVEALRPLSSRSLVHGVFGRINHDRLDKRLYWLLEYWHFLPQWKSQIRLLGGRFLTADTGVGVDFIRQFGSVELGIGVRDTSTSRLVQITLSMPLSPRRQPQPPQRVRVRVEDYVEQQLRSVIEGVNYLYLEDITARELSLGPDLRNTFLDRYRFVPESGWWPGQ